MLKYTFLSLNIILRFMCRLQSLSFTNDRGLIFKTYRRKGSRRGEVFKETPSVWTFQTCQMPGCQRLTARIFCVVRSQHWNCTFTQRRAAAQMVSPPKRANAFQRRINGIVVVMERDRQWPDLEGLLPWRPLEGPKAAVDSQLMPSG